nr:MAG TPA: optinuerin [Caudoviricetes sp.]
MAKKVKQINREYSCKDCKHSFDYHSKALDGHMILCRCKFHQWCKFLNSDYCEHFELKR